MNRKIILFLFLPIFLFGHTRGDITGGFISGFLHPISGFDHIIAMIAVGLWGAILKKPSIWVLPITFPIIMAMGGAIGAIGIEIPFIEIGIALSGIVLGVMVALEVKLPLFFAMVLVGIFAIFHGFAHGVELPKALNPIAYSAGFVISTGILHLIGILIGLVDRYKKGIYFIRALGVLITLIGTYFLYFALK